MNKLRTTFKLKLGDRVYLKKKAMSTSILFPRGKQVEVRGFNIIYQNDNKSTLIKIIVRDVWNKISWWISIDQINRTYHLERGDTNYSLIHKQLIPDFESCLPHL